MDSTKLSGRRWRQRGRWFRGALAAGLIAGALAGVGPAHAEELGHSVWLPLVDPELGAEETFERNTLSVIRAGEAAWRACRGKYRESVSQHDFFITVGRPDLAGRESSRRTTHNVLVVGGYGALVVGAGLAYASLQEGGFDPPLAWVGGVAGAGALAVLVSNFFEGAALPATEAEGLAARYNDRLRAHLERPHARDSKIMAADTRPRLLPWFARGAGGLALAASF